MTQRKDEEMVAYALEADVALLPYLPELLADLDELGSDAELIAEVICDLELPSDAHVIDLGCGRGGVAVEIAEELELAVTGIELFEPFVDACQQLAERRGVADRCKFVHGDVSTMAMQVPKADVAVYAALGDVLGRLDETIAIIRRYVKPGGYLVVSDVFLAEGASSDYPGFEQYAEREETIRRLTSCGDVLVREVLLDGEGEEGEEDDDESEDEVDEGELIAARAANIAKRQPELAAALQTFVDSQHAENEFIDQNLIDAVWVLQRAG